MRTGDIVTIARRAGLWVVDHRAANATDVQCFCFKPNRTGRSGSREGITAPANLIKLVWRPSFLAGMVVSYDSQPTVVVEDAGDVVLLNIMRRREFQGGGWTTQTSLGLASVPASSGKAGHEGQPVNKAEIVAQNISFFYPKKKVR
jgi:hypothetical protein